MPSLAHAPASILVVDDEESVQELLRYELSQDGHRVTVAGDGQAAIELFDSQPFDLVVLDIMLPHMDGMDVLREIRANSDVPVIMLTARAHEFDKVLGLEIGADDYVTKDLLSMREFRSRVRAQLRRAALSSEAAARKTGARSHGGLQIDVSRRTVSRNGVPVRLTFVEFEILKALTTHPGQVYTRRMLLQLLWGESDYRDERTIDTHIRHLREKLESDPSRPEFIFTVRSVGYTFRES